MTEEQREDEAEHPMDVIEADNDLQSAADLFEVPRELLGDADRLARGRRLRRKLER
jgi:hypothetical protein